MSGFRRYRSRVFWSQMESRDLGGGVLALQPVGSPAARPREEQVETMELSAEENADGAPGSEPENATVVRVEVAGSSAGSSADSISNNPSIGIVVGDTTTTTTSTASASAAAAATTSDELAERSFSPTSRGQRSQDSGFSDSGRSESSGPDESPRRHRQRRRRRGHRPRLESLGSVAGEGRGRVDGPQRAPGLLVRTSTPNRQQQRGRPRAETASIDRFSSGAEAKDSEDSRDAAEALEDFLYAVEPVEEAGDEVDSRQVGPVEARAGRGPRALDPRLPVKAWLRELGREVEDECMATLQSKSLPRRRHRDEGPESRDLRLLAASATTAAKKIIDAADKFEARYQRVLGSIGGSKSSGLERDQLESFEAEAAKILAKLGAGPARRIARRENSRSIALQLGRLKSSVDRALDNRLDFYIEKVVRGLEEAPREGGGAARGVLAALTALGQAGPRAGASLARCSGIRALLAGLAAPGRPPASTELRSAGLRALASVCCCLEAVDQFVGEDGPGLLAGALAAPGAALAERSEAAALLVQITAPWMDRVGLPYVEPHARRLVEALADLAERTDCRQTLLLASAALNQLASSRRCVAAIVECDALKRLLRCVKKSNGGSVWVMEQVAALISQIARWPQARGYLVESRASVALVCFLRMQPPGLEDEYRSLEATASEALTRLCVEPEIAKQVVAVGGSGFLPADAHCTPLRGDERPLRSCTKSLRMARRIAAEQIDNAKKWETSPR